MKNFFVLCISIILFLAYCAGVQVHEGQQYIRLSKPVDNVPELLEFFSFYCPHCYHFEEKYKISKNIDSTLPQGMHIVKYHVDFLGHLGKELTQAWAVAIVLGIEDQISSLIFTELHKRKSLRTIQDIRLIFVKFGITDRKYDLVWNSVEVQSLILKQQRAVINFQLHGVPVIFINGKYMIKNDALNISSVDAYIRQCSEIIHLLISKV